MTTVDFGIISKNKNYWFSGFEEAIKKRNYSYKVIEIDRNDWLKQIEDVDNIISRFPLKYIEEGREKLYIMERILHKNVYPNQDTYWHYDNKNAQKYLSEIYNNIPLPKSFVSYSYSDSLDYIKNAKYPLVSKSSHGASSRNVRLLNNFGEAKKELDYIFGIGKLNSYKEKIFQKTGLVSNKYGMQKRYVHYQEFVPNNTGDLKIITIGDKFAYAYYRGNRDNDFRASGSGKNNYSPELHHMDAIKYFLKVSKENNFDSMGYDLLFTNEGFVTSEISFTTVEKYLYKCQGYYELVDDVLKFNPGHTWPQELILTYLEGKWIGEKIKV